MAKARRLSLSFEDWCSSQGYNHLLSKKKLKQEAWSIKWASELPKELHVTDKREYYRKEYLRSDHWVNLRAAKLAKTKQCERCSSQVKLDVHHKVYRSLYDVTLEDLETLCRKCHHEHHEAHKTPKKKKRLKQHLFQRRVTMPENCLRHTF